MITSISLENIRKGYPSSDFSFWVDNLEFCNQGIQVIVGPNGSGKSTLLKLISLMDEPDEGRILFGGQDIFRREKERERLRKHIGFVVQSPYLFNMSVSENVALGLKLRKYPRRKVASKVEEMLERLKIGHLAPRNIKELSAGEYQKTALAQVLVLEPEVLLLDEPTASIDAQSGAAIEETIKSIQQRSRTIIVMTTHSLNQAYRISPDIISLAEGKVVDFVHENVFYGKLKEHSGGLKSMKVAAQVEIILTTEKSGNVHIALDPKDIILAKQSPKTSARNCFRGKVTKIESLGPNVRLLIDIGVGIYSIITKQSFKELGLNLGSEVFVSFKVNSVKVI